MERVIAARHAMATRFEIVLYGDNVAGLRGAASQALDEIERVEARLSRFLATSEIAAVNAMAARQPVHVSPEVFQLLERARNLSQLTGGAFDITVGHLMLWWGAARSGGPPDDRQLDAARASVGFEHLHLDVETSTVRFHRPNMTVDLGAIGKGYAIERAVEVLRDAGVDSAFIHGGTSTVYGLGTPPDAKGWGVAIDSSPALAIHRRESGVDRPLASRPLAIISLKDRALSVSAPSGKSFNIGEEVFGHVIDPRTGRPVAMAALAMVATANATETDALSTALLVMGLEGCETIASLFPDSQVLAATLDSGEDGLKIRSRGVDLASD